jgi:hypothetical protein
MVDISLSGSGEGPGWATSRPTLQVFYKIVPHFDAQELRQYLHQVMATFSTIGKEVVMVVDRSGIHRAHKLDATLDHSQGTFRFHFLPAHCGHHLNPLEGFWRVMKDAIGAGRCVPDLPQLYQRTRHVLMAHQERPIWPKPNKSATRGNKPC